MLKLRQRTAATLTLSLALLFCTVPATAQSATAVTTLDIKRLMGVWYEVARYPVSPEKHCLADGAVLYTLGDKKNNFQRVTSCTIKDNNSDSWNAKGKFDKAGSGKLKLSRFLILSKKYWVFAIGPEYEWALVGSPNHRSLWVLSRTTNLDPGVLAGIQAKAAASGFDVSKLKPMPQPAK